MIAATTGLCAALERHVSLTSQAMLYLVAVVIVAYACDRITAVASAVAAVTAFNFFFVPPRYTLAVENRDHLIALTAMLGVALLVSWLSGRVRAESRLAAESECRARQLSTLATELLDGPTKPRPLPRAGGPCAARSSGSCSSRAMQRVGPASESTALAPQVLHSTALPIDEAAVDRPGHRPLAGDRCWVVPLGSRGHVVRRGAHRAGASGRRVGA